jgi:hypothetical protein
VIFEPETDAKAEIACRHVPAAKFWAIAGCLLCASAATFANVQMTTSATGEYQYNTNVFNLQSGANTTAPGITAPSRGDSDFGYGGALNLDDNVGLQDFFLHLSGKELRYDHYTDLNHDEYKLDGGLKWKLWTEVDGLVEVSRTRSMIAFYDLTPTAQATLQLPIETEQREAGQVNFFITPDFRVESSAYRRVVDEPLDATPNLQLTENEGQTAVKYLGTAKLTSGFSVAYLTGRYDGGSALSNPSYDQGTVDFVTSYQASGLSNVTGEVGYSRRTSAVQTNNVSGVTGKIDYRGQLTAKSALELAVDREITSYIANAGAEIDTTGTIIYNWQITYKIGLSVLYSDSSRNYPDQGLVPGTRRTDHQQDASLKFDYEVRRWLSIKPYITYETRSSAYVGASFSSTIFGISVTAHSIQ